MARFTRASTAYDDNGNVVAAGVPRFGTNGLKIEEGTTNLVPISEQDFKTGWISLSGEGITVSDYDVYIPELGKTVTAKRITGDGKGTGTYKYRTDTVGYVPGDVITTSIYMQVLNGNTVTIASNLHDGTLAVSDSLMKKRVFTRTGATTAIAQIGFVVPSVTSVLDIVVYQAQQEKKAYATSYISGTRAAEQLTIPSNTLGTMGTIERTFAPLITGILRYLFDAGGTDGNNIAVYIDTLNIVHAKIGTYVLDGTTALTAASHKIALSYDTVGATLYVDGSPVATTVFIPAPSLVFGSVLYEGCRQDSTCQQDGYTAQLRYSSTRHTDTQIATDAALSTLPLTADTTYYMLLTSDIGAQASPVVSIRGNGTVSASRQGTGQRSISIIGTEKTQVDSIRKSFVSVDISALSRVSTVRQGKGVRNTVISGISNVNIIEPLITADLGITERQGETEVEGVPLVGNTVRITAKFHTFSGALADPTSITLTFYDFNNMQIGATVNITAANRVSAGVYLYDYVVPDGYRKIYYEFAGIQENTRQAFAGHIDVQRVQNY